MYMKSWRGRAAIGALTCAWTMSALAVETDALQSIVTAEQRASGAPGMTAAVITSDSIRVFASGQRRLGSPEWVDRGDTFGIGSNAKAMLGMLVAQQVEAGRLRWDTTIAEVLPEVMVRARREYRGVTITQLLQHQSGFVQLLSLEDAGKVPKLRGSIIEQRLQFANWAVHQAPVATPGTEVRYSNAGYVVAAAMLERVTGRSYEEQLRCRLLTPLGIDARFEWPAAHAKKHEPWGHLAGDGKLTPIAPNNHDFDIPDWINPAGNLSMSARDLGRFVQVNLRGLQGTSTFLNQETFVRLHTPTLGYAYGWAVVELVPGQPISHHQGSTDIFYSLMFMVPSLDIAVVVLANSDTPQMEETANRLAVELIEASLQ